MTTITRLACMLIALALLAGCATKAPIYGCLATRTEKGTPGMLCAPLDDAQEK